MLSPQRVKKTYIEKYSNSNLVREKIQLKGLDGLKLYNMIADKKKSSFILLILRAIAATNVSRGDIDHPMLMQMVNPMIRQRVLSGH